MRARDIAALVCIMTGGACSSLLDVDVPGRIAADRLEDPAMADLETRSVQQAFECTVTEYAGSSGLFVGELWHTSNFSGRDNFGNRIYSAIGGGETGACPSNDAPFAAKGFSSSAMALGRDVTKRYEAWTDAQLSGRGVHLAKVTAWTAYAINLMGEGSCQAVVEPLGAALEPPAIFKEAETWFTKSIGYAQGAGGKNVFPGAPADSALNLAMLGRARARLNMRDFNGAVADASLIPANFFYNATRSTVLQRVNRVWAETYRFRGETVASSFRNLTVGGVADPRVRVQNMGFKGSDGIVDAYYPLKYNTADQPARAASWQEAQLIIAEARLGQTAVDAINAVRVKDGITGAGTVYVPVNVNDNDEVLDQVLEERRREFFLEGHRLGDVIRHKGRAGMVFPEGLNAQGNVVFFQNYCLPMSQAEIDRNLKAHDSAKTLSEAVDKGILSSSARP